VRRTVLLKEVPASLSKLEQQSSLLRLECCGFENNAASDACTHQAFHLIVKEQIRKITRSIAATPLALRTAIT